MPAVVDILDFGRTGDRLYYIMDYFCNNLRTPGWVPLITQPRNRKQTRKKQRWQAQFQAHPAVKKRGAGNQDLGHRVPRGRDHCLSPVFDAEQKWLWSADKSTFVSAWNLNLEMGFVGRNDFTGFYHVKAVYSAF